MKTLTDEQLMDLIRQSDKKAFEELFNRHYNPLIRFAKYRTFDKAIAEDIVANVFMGLWHKRETVYIPCEMEAFFIVNIKCKIIDHFRKQNSQKKYLKETYIAEPATENTDHIIRHNQMSSIIQEQIDLLPPKYKQIVELMRFQNLKREEVVEQLGIPLNTVKTILSRAQRKLSAGLKEFMTANYRIHNKKGRT